MDAWPELDEVDKPTIATLHLISQMVGKVPTALLPWRNHGWHLALHVTARGLATEPISSGGRDFQLTLDLVDHCITLEEGGEAILVGIRRRSIADVWRALHAAFAARGIAVKLNGRPNEIEGALRFADDDAERRYEPDSARRLHGALLCAARVFWQFRSSFLGKVSPVHFFWGSFDLAVTRFSGQPAPTHPGGVPGLPDAVTQEAYSHEVSSAGFWPGGAGMPGGPLFYAYAYPTPAGFADAKAQPDVTRFDADLGEFVLDYEAVRGASDPDAVLLAFLQSTYEAAADLAKWDRQALECAPGRPRVPRKV